MIIEFIADFAEYSVPEYLEPGVHWSKWYPSNSANHMVLGTLVLGTRGEGHRKLISADHERANCLPEHVGDGLADLVSVRNVEVCCSPDLGRGRFGNKINMTGAPVSMTRRNSTAAGTPGTSTALGLRCCMSKRRGDGFLVRRERQRLELAGTSSSPSGAYRL